MKKIFVMVPRDSSFKPPLVKGFAGLGYQVICFDYRYLLGNFHLVFYWPTVLFEVAKILISYIFRENDLNKAQSDLVNSKVANIIKKINPELVFVVKGENLEVKTIEEVKKLGIKTVLWQVDPAFNEKIWPWFQVVGPHYDVVLLAEEGRIKEFKSFKWPAKIIHMLAAAEDGVGENLTHTKKVYDLTFVGTKNPERVSFFKPLKDQDLHIWGYQWEKTEFDDHFYGVMPYKNLLETYAKSKIVLATTQSPFISVNNRVFEAGIVESFVLIEYNRYLPDLLEIDKEIVTFKTPKQLREKVLYYLSHEDERKKIARALRKRVLESHTYNKRLKQVLDQI